MSVYDFAAEQDKGDYRLTPIYYTGTNDQPVFTITSKVKPIKPIKIVTLNRPFKHGYEKIGIFDYDISNTKDLEGLFINLQLECITHTALYPGYSLDRFLVVDEPVPVARFELDFDSFNNLSAFHCNPEALSCKKEKVGIDIINTLNEVPFSFTITVKGLVRWKDGTNKTNVWFDISNIEF